MAAKKSGNPDPILEELVAIKRLLAFAIMKSGASQAQVATALGVDQSQISRMFPKGSSGRARSGRR